jgi:hypothetical protein
MYFSGSGDDWKQESSRMGDIYANSVVTIAAWGASSCEQGLFAARDPLSVLGCKLFDRLVSEFPSNGADFHVEEAHPAEVSRVLTLHDVADFLGFLDRFCVTGENQCFQCDLRVGPTFRLQILLNSLCPSGALPPDKLGSGK